LKSVSLKEHFSLLLLLSLTVMLVMAGESMLTAALPEIEHEFSVPGIYESWILPIVLLVGAAASPFVGTAGDMYGHKRLLVICLLVYCAGLFGGVFAPDIWVLLFSRALQGAGIAAFPLGYAIIKEQLPETMADTGIGVISAMYGAGTFIGVITGSFITGLFSWRVTYMVLIPASCILVLLVWKYVKNDDKVITRGSLDYAGLISLIFFLFLFLWFFSLPPGERFSPFEMFVLACAVAGMSVFVFVERRAPSPLADFKLMKMRPVMVFMVIGFLTIIAFFTLLQMMPFIIRLPSGLGLTAAMVGLILIPGALCDMIAGPLTGRMIPVTGCRPPCILGSLLLLGAGVLLYLSPLSIVTLVIAWTLFSFGMSMVATADLIGVMDYVSEDRTAEATGIIQSMQTLGGMTGPIITGTILATSGVSMMYQGELWEVPETGTYYLVFLTVILVSSVLLLISWLFVKDQPEKYVRDETESVKGFI
jgi:MFS family permease